MSIVPRSQVKRGLPPSFVKRGLERAKGMRLFGQPVEDLTRDELLAALAEIAHMCDVQRESQQQTVEFLFDLARARRR